MDEYDNAWAEGEAAAAEPSPAPGAALNPAKAAYESERSSQAKEFSDAFHSDAPTTAKPEAKPASFKDAFRAARAGGLKTFDFNGKKYTTELKAEPVAAKPVVAVAPKQEPVRPPKPAEPLSRSEVKQKPIDDPKGRTKADYTGMGS